MLERIRLIAELIGISAVVLSLFFVGFELKQTREMDLAQLHFNRMEMYHSRMLAVLESEPALSAFAKRIESDGSSVDFTGTERSAMHAIAHAQIAEWEAEFRYIEQGFATRTLASLENEISVTTAGYPEIRVVWESWNMPGMQSYSFNAMMNRLLNPSGQ